MSNSIFNLFQYCNFSQNREDYYRERERAREREIDRERERDRDGVVDPQHSSPLEVDGLLAVVLRYVQLKAL